MNKGLLGAVILLLALPGIAGIPRELRGQEDTSWRTDYEKSGYLRTPRYAETLEYCRRLADASPWVSYTTFGTSPQGRALPLLIVSKGGTFDPGSARASGKPIVLIQSCIHAGESDGKDASLMLVRDLVITRRIESLLDGVILLVVPIFSVDGHERFGPFNRINQNGPEEMGWRVTAQNLNLNRDYLKADAPEMRAMLRLFTAWLPDLTIDCHVTDGIDFQYDVTYAMEVYQNIDPEISAWTVETYLPALTASVESSGHPIAPYIWPREDRDIRKGFASGAAPPRFSTGYGALQNRPVLLVETHALKPYRTRVNATYEILVSTLRILNAHGRALRGIVTRADRRAAALSLSVEPQYIPLRMTVAPTSTPWLFRGVRTLTEFSEISGTERIVYTADPETLTVPHFHSTVVTDSVRVPRFYLVPQEWSSVLDVLRAHGVAMKRLASGRRLKVERLVLKNPVWQARPYEGRHTVRFQSETFEEEERVPSGCYVIPTAQRTAFVIVHLLEPHGPDSFVSWGFFDAVFEQKEYAEPYVMEQLARTMLKEDPALETEFRSRLAADSAFAASPYARLDFFYRRSPYWDRTLGVYPVARVFGEIREDALTGE